jgi:hypothetical protein
VGTTTPHATARIRAVLEPDQGVMPVRRWPVSTPVALELGVRALFADSGAIRVGVLLAHRDAQGPMDGDLLVFAHGGT